MGQNLSWLEFNENVKTTNNLNNELLCVSNACQTIVIEYLNPMNYD